MTFATHAAVYFASLPNISPQSDRWSVYGCNAAIIINIGFAFPSRMSRHNTSSIERSHYIGVKFIVIIIRLLRYGAIAIQSTLAHCSTLSSSG